MSTMAVINRAIKDPAFANTLKDQAEKAAKSGYGSPEFDALLSNFATTPQELAHLKSLRKPNRDFGWEPTLTLLTLTTLGCTTTTTTTTTIGADLQVVKNAK